ADKFRAFGWFAHTVDGHNYDDILAAFDLFRREGGTRPRALVAKTFKGKGVSLLENKEGWHGKPVPKADLDKALAELSQPLSSEEWKPNPRPAPARKRVESSVRTFAVSRKPGQQAATREAY